MRFAPDGETKLLLFGRKRLCGKRKRVRPGRKRRIGFGKLIAERKPGGRSPRRRVPGKRLAHLLIGRRRLLEIGRLGNLVQRRQEITQRFGRQVLGSWPDRRAKRSRRLNEKVPGNGRMVGNRTWSMWSSPPAWCLRSGRAAVCRSCLEHISPLECARFGQACASLGNSRISMESMTGNHAPEPGSSISARR